MSLLRIEERRFLAILSNWGCWFSNQFHTNGYMVDTSISEFQLRVTTRQVRCRPCSSLWKPKWTIRLNWSMILLSLVFLQKGDPRWTMVVGVSRHWMNMSTWQTNLLSKLSKGFLKLRWKEKGVKTWGYKLDNRDRMCEFHILFYFEYHLSFSDVPSWGTRLTAHSVLFFRYIFIPHASVSVVSNKSEIFILFC